MCQIYRSTIQSRCGLSPLLLWPLVIIISLLGRNVCIAPVYAIFSTDGVALSLCSCVCVCVCVCPVTTVNCKNGQTDRDAVWSAAQGAEETIIRRGTEFQEIRAFEGRVMEHARHAW